MDGKFNTALVLTLVGAGGTLLSLWFIVLAVELLKKVFPYHEEKEENKKEIPRCSK